MNYSRVIFKIIAKVFRTAPSLKPIYLFVLPTIFSFIVLIILSVPYLFSKITPFSSLGFYSIVEKYPDYVFKYINIIELIKGDKVQGNIVSNENNLGVVLVRFYNYEKINKDKVVFRIKENDEKDWYYTNTYKVDQFQPNQYFTFGFPVIENSRNKNYYFEIESLNGIHLNAIAISEKTPRIALVYQYSREKLLKEKSVIPTFLLKKFKYTIDNVNKFNIINAWIVTFLILIVISRWRKLLMYTFLFFTNILLFIIPIFAKDYTSSYLKYISYLKRLYRFFIDIYGNILYINKRFFPILHILIIVFIALIFRINYYIDPNNFSNFFYTQMGSDGDYDLLMKHTINYLTDPNGSLSSYFWLDDWVINLRLFALFFKLFGFVKGIDLFEYFLIILSILVSLGPFVLLSRLKRFSIGGFMASLFLAVNPLSIKLALVTPLDTMTSFTFLLFIIFYILSIEKKNYFFAGILGALGFLDVLNHGLQMLNNLPALVLFAGYHIVIKSKFKRSIRFLLISKGNFFYSFLPLIVFLLFYFTWNNFYYFLIHSSYNFSPETIISTWNPINYPQNILGTSIVNKLLSYFIKINLVISSLQSYINIPIFASSGLFIFICYLRNLLKSKRFIILSIILAVYVFLIFMLKTMLIKFPGLFVGLNDNSTYWFRQMKINDFILIFFFFEALVLYLFLLKNNFFKYFLVIVTYLFVLFYGFNHRLFERHFIQAIIPFFILFGVAIDAVKAQIISRKDSLVSKKLFNLYSVIILVAIATYTIPLIKDFILNTISMRQEIIYLQKAKTVIPSDGIVLISNHDGANMTWVSTNTKRATFFSTNHPDPRYIPAQKTGNQDYPYLSKHPLLETILDNEKIFKTKKLYMLDYNINLWNKILAGKDFRYPFAERYGGRFQLKKIYDYNGRGVYKLELKNHQTKKD